MDNNHDSWLIEDVLACRAANGPKRHLYHAPGKPPYQVFFAGFYTATMISRMPRVTRIEQPDDPVGFSGCREKLTLQSTVANRGKYMFDDESQMICWFDTAIEKDAIGVPERELDTVMHELGGSLAITEHAYASAGRVKAVVIKGLGLGLKMDRSIDPIERLRDFTAGFGLELICRPRSGTSIELNGGRYYGRQHDPSQE